MEVDDKESLHKLNNNWSLWAHLPQDVNWSLDSYKKIYTFNTIEEAKALYKNLPDNCIKNCMLFIMRDNIQPIWEDDNNKDGGSFSYKIINKNVKEFWIDLSYYLVGETILKDNNIPLKISGITISPKKNFCIIKIWVDNCNYQNIDILNDNIGLNEENCIFKKHIQQ